MNIKGPLATGIRVFAYDIILVLVLWTLSVHLQHPSYSIVKTVEYSAILATFPGILLLNILPLHEYPPWAELTGSIFTLLLGPLFWAVLGYWIHKLCQKKYT